MALFHLSDVVTLITTHVTDVTHHRNCTTPFVVVDAMHNLFLGLIHEHFSGILDIQLQPDKEKDIPVLHCNFSDAWRNLGSREQASMRRIIHWLEQLMILQLSTEEEMKQ